MHAREAETFIVLEGALEAWSESGLHLVEAGQLVHLPAGQEHAFRVASEEAHFYTLVSPAGFEGFFHETGVPTDAAFTASRPVRGPRTPVVAAALAAGAAHYGCTVLGPPPFGP